MRNEQILVSGAGIAGLTTAYWLARFGFRPTVVEQAPGLRRGGQGVDVREQAIEVVERMGIWSCVRARATDVRGMRFVNADGIGIGRMDMQRIKDKHGSTEVEIMRGDLVGLLHEISSGSVAYRFDTGIQALDQRDDGVTVTFDDGRAQQFDLVVGADGLHSMTRRLAFGPETDFLRYLDHYAAFGNAEAELGPDRWVTLYNAPGIMAGIYRSGNHSQAKAYFAFRSPRLGIDTRDRSVVHTLLTDRFGAISAWNVKPLLDSALADPELYFDSLAQVGMKSWSAGRVVLVGDAAYCASPVSGGGAELALTGAYRLAGELAAARGDHRRAFDRYEQAQRPLVRQRQKIGPNLRLLVPKSRTGIAFRNALTRLPVLDSMAGMDRIMAPRTNAALPEYLPPA